METILIRSEPPHEMFHMFTILSLSYSLILINIKLWAFIISLCSGVGITRSPALPSGGRAVRVLLMMLRSFLPSREGIGSK